MTIPTPNIQSWSYSHDPSTSDKDAVRFIVGDTNSDDKLLDDNEILWVLEQEGNVQQAAICCLQNLITVYSRYVDKTGKGSSTAHGMRVENFRTALDSLLEKQAMGALEVFAGGISRSQKQVQEDNPDTVPPKFTKNMFDNPRAVQPDWPGDSYRD